MSASRRVGRVTTYGYFVGKKLLGRGHHVFRHAKEIDGSSGNGEDQDDITNVELFRQSLIRGWGEGEVGSAETATAADWAQPLPEDRPILPGDVLLGDPAGFFADEDTGPLRSLLGFFGDSLDSRLRRIGMRGRIAADLPQRERLRVLPVILVIRSSASDGVEGVWLTMRTGELMGDYINHFHSRPLLFGGPSGTGLTMVHPYSQVHGSSCLTKEGLHLGGDFGSAQQWADEGQGSSLRFRFFIGRVKWAPGELEAEMKQGKERLWIPLRCSMDLVLSEVDSIDEKPLWVRMAELAGGQAEEAGRRYDLL